jgi:hypothetical protein
MEQILAHLLVEMNAMEERLDIKIGAEIKTIREERKTNQERMEGKIDGQEEMKAQVGSLASRVDVNQEEAIAKVDAWIEGTEPVYENWRPIETP